MPAPTIDPSKRDPSQVAPADSYHPADPVWVYRSGSWRAGVIVTASSHAAMVTYRPTHARGTAVDTLAAVHLHPRADVDPLLDGVTHT